jgi:hypothetical protein
VIGKPAFTSYHINLIRDLRERETKSALRQRMSAIIGLGCFGFFIISLLYSGLTIMQMERVLKSERDKLEHLKLEYRKYKSTNLIVDKADIELLSGLQGKGIFWTKKLSAIAKHLPDSYSITAINYTGDELKVTGSGFSNPQQDQLQILDKYMNELRADKSFSDVFKLVYLNSAVRQDKEGQVKIAFSFSAFTSKGKRK